MIRQISFCILNNEQDDKRLGPCIQSIHLQKIPCYEIIALGAAGKEEGVQYLDRGKSATVNAMRNSLCKKSSNEFIAFIGPNLELAGDWFEMIKNADDCFDIIGSKLSNPDNVRAIDWGYEFKIGDKVFASPLNYDEWTNKAFVSGGLMLFRRQVWERIKFDESVSSAEADFCLRAAAAGYRVGVFPEASAKYRTASLTFEESLRQVGRYRDAYAAGMAAFRNGEHEKAVKAYKRAIDTAPNEPNACGRMGWAYYSLGKYDDSIKAFEKALIHDPFSNYALRGRGWAYIQKGDHVNALADFSIAVECIKPNDKDAFIESFRGFCWSYYFMGEFDKAIENFTLFLGKLDGEKGVLQDVYRGLGWSNLRTGKNEEAARNFEQALVNIEDNEDIKREAMRGLDEARSSLRSEGKQPEAAKKEVDIQRSRHMEEKQAEFAKKNDTVIDVPSLSHVDPQISASPAKKPEGLKSSVSKVTRRITKWLSKYM